MNIAKVGKRKISIITPARNAENLIGRTVESVINQTAVISGELELEYIICDGASTDRTVEVAKSIAGSQVNIISEPDSGMYEALAKGLRKATGDIVAYINAGDYYNLYAFELATHLMERFNISWLTGSDVYYNESGHVISYQVPYRYRSLLIRQGVYGSYLPYIQQESTFWKRELLDLVDLDKVSEMKLAGDYCLWYYFAQRHQLRIVNTHLAGFTIHSNRQSLVHRGAYKGECRALTGRVRLSQFPRIVVDKMIWYLPPRIKQFFNKNLILFNRHSGTWATAKEGTDK